MMCPSGHRYRIRALRLQIIDKHLSVPSKSYFCRNLIMRSLELSDVASFGSAINPVKYVLIRISNMFAIILTLGFMIPWANGRVHKYLSECSKINITGDLDKFDDAVKNKSSFGEELAELEGFEVTV